MTVASKRNLTEPEAVAMFATSQRSTPAYVRRDSSALADRRALPQCRAWRIIAAPAAELAAAAWAVAGGKVAAAPAGAVAGAFPVWVQPVDPDGKLTNDPPIYVDGPGWRNTPMGPGWCILYGPAGGLAADVLCFVVETVDDLAEVGGAQ